MTVALKPAQRRLVIQAAAGLACVAIVVIALWILAGFAGSHDSPTSGYQQVQATVTKTASCQGSDTNDSISFSVNGGTHQAKLDGCGYSPGEKMAVLVPASYDSGTVLEPSEAAPGNSSGLSHRVAFILLIVATIAGGASSYQLFRTRDQFRSKGQQDGPPPALPALRPLFGRKRSARRSSGPEPEPVADYHSDIRPLRRNRDPSATGVDWFEDSSTHMHPVPPPPDVGRRPDRP